MKRYKTITVTKRVRIKDLHFINGNLADITFQERRRMRVKKPVTPGSLVFHGNGYTIVWEDDSVRVSPVTFRLVQQFWVAHDRFLSKEDVRQDVVEDDDASETVLRVLIAKARKELKAVHFPYEIVTEWGKGYRLVPGVNNPYAGGHEERLNVPYRATSHTALTRRAEAVKLTYG